MELLSPNVYPSFFNAHPQLTCKAWKVFLQVRRLYFVGQDVGLVEEEDDGGAMEPRRMDGGVEQSQTLVHAILGAEIEIWCQAGRLSGDGGDVTGGFTGHESFSRNDFGTNGGARWE